MKKGKVVLKILITIICIALIIFAVIGIGATIFVRNKLNKINYVELDLGQVEVNDEVKEQEEELKGYRTIALLGIDSRADNYNRGNRSDCIMLAVINQDTKEISLVSVYRDTYLKIKGYGLDKVTHAYSFGGPELAISTLNTNFDLNIKEFVTVNFDAVKDIIDSIDGITMTITSEEVPHISGINQAGTYNLTGEQALAYARIRYAEGGDYKRAERMRDVLTAVVNKVKTFDISRLNKLVDMLLPKVYTNLTSSDIFSMMPSLPSFKITESIGWPYETKGITLDRWYGVPVTLESNVTRLHKEVFEEDDYTPSETVRIISNSIIEKTGYNK